MPDLKVLIGGRNYNISCSSGEENAATESANLLDQEAELIQGQLGRLPEDKMLLLSGLLLGDKIRALKHERSALEETLRVTQSKFNELSSRVDGETKSVATDSTEAYANEITKDEGNQVALLQSISDLLDGIILEFEKPNSDKNKQVNSTEVNKNTQESFL